MKTSAFASRPIATRSIDVSVTGGILVRLRRLGRMSDICLHLIGASINLAGLCPQVFAAFNFRPYEGRAGRREAGRSLSIAASGLPARDDIRVSVFSFPNEPSYLAQYRAQSAHALQSIAGPVRPADQVFMKYIYCGGGNTHCVPACMSACH